MNKNWARVIKTTDGRHIEIPKYARFKLALRLKSDRKTNVPGIYHDNNAVLYFHSWDIRWAYINGQRVYYRNEQASFMRLRDLVNRKYKPWEWYAATIFATCADPANTETSDYNQRIITFYPVKKDEWCHPNALQFKQYTSLKYPVINYCFRMDLNHWQKIVYPPNNKKGNYILNNTK